MKSFLFLILSINIAYADVYRDELQRYNLRDSKLKQGLQDLKPEYEQERLSDLDEDSPRLKPSQEEGLEQEGKEGLEKASTSSNKANKDEIDLNSMPVNMTKQQAMELGRRLKNQQIQQPRR